MGTLAAGINLQRQPDECGQRWADLPARLDEDARSIAKRYIDFVRGPINERVTRCFEFNENQRLGLMGQQTGSAR